MTSKQTRSAAIGRRCVVGAKGEGGGREVGKDQSEARSGAMGSAQRATDSYAGTR